MMEPQTPSLYAILQVDPKASSREIDAAYARLRRGKGSDKEGYKALKHAYKVLSSRNDREIYDAEQAALANAKRVREALQRQREGGDGEGERETERGRDRNRGDTAGGRPRSRSRGAVVTGGLKGLIPDLPRTVNAPPTPRGQVPGRPLRVAVPPVAVGQYHNRSPYESSSHGHGHGHSSHGHGSSHGHSSHGHGSHSSPHGMHHGYQFPPSQPSPLGPNSNSNSPSVTHPNLRRAKSPEIPLPQAIYSRPTSRQAQGHLRSTSLPPLPMQMPMSMVSPTLQARGDTSRFPQATNPPPRLSLSPDTPDVDPWLGLDATKRKSAMQHDRRFRAEYENHLVTPPLPTSHESFTIMDTEGRPIGKGYTVKWAEKGGGLRTWTGTTRGKSSGGVLAGAVWSYS